MVKLNDFRKISDFEWELPAGFRDDMRAAVRFFATRSLLEDALNDLSIEQAMNAATLPGVTGHVMVMPDVHQGYGFPIGGVAAMRYEDGVVSPGAIGYDINCGVRLMASRIELEEARPLLDKLAVALDHFCPSGVGTRGERLLKQNELEDVCAQGSRWAIKSGAATEMDLASTEEGGRLGGANPSAVSRKAFERAKDQLGTLGSGNHFIEVDVVDGIFDACAAEQMGLDEGCLCLLIHCGSRGFGHQICTDYVQDFQSVARRYGIQLPDRELVCAPLESPEGMKYLEAMRCAANYAFANRQLLAHQARKAFESVFAGKVSDWHLFQVYDIAHNMGKEEIHQIEGRETRVCLHRKGATRAFGPGSVDVPDSFRDIGQPVLVPGSMGTASWVLVGTEMSMERSLGSCCHGAGRVMSRTKAKHSVRGEDLRRELLQHGIRVQAGSNAGLAEEAPQAYKDVDEVVKVVSGAGIARKVARLRPVVVVKG